jgi:hypothetical protein
MYLDVINQYLAYNPQAKGRRDIHWNICTLFFSEQRFNLMIVPCARTVSGRNEGITIHGK